MPRSSSILPNFRRDGRSFNVAVMASESVAASGEQFKTSCYITYTYTYICIYTHIYIYRLHEGRAQLTSINHQIGAFQFARRSRISDHTMRLSHDPRPGGHRDKQADFLRAQLPTSLVGGRTLYKSNAQTSWNNPLLSNCIILLYDLYVRPTKTSSWFWSNICYCCCLSICWWGTFSNGFGLYKSSKNSRYLFPQHLSRLPRLSSQAVFSNSILCWSPFS